MIEKLMRRDRILVLASLITVISLSWLYILTGAGMDMDATMPMSYGMKLLSPVTRWTLGYTLLLFFMWWVMMIAMMLPSAAPMIVLFAVVNRKNHTGGRAFVPTSIFASGYIVAWGGFSLLAVFLQWSLQHLTLLSPMMVTSSVSLPSVSVSRPVDAGTRSNGRRVSLDDRRTLLDGSPPSMRSSLPLRRDRRKSRHGLANSLTPTFG